MTNRNVLVTVRNTGGKKYRWCTSYIETLLVQLWYPISVCTLSREMHQIVLDGLKETGDPESLSFKIHDFGMRGSSSMESSAIGGLSHLVYSKGTDTMSALMAAEDCYHCDMAGFSIAAAEHSTITSWGKENEVEAYRNMLKTFTNDKLVAVVSDSYNIFDACSKLWGGVLKDEVLAYGAKGGTLVIRPDSGDILPTLLGVLEILEEKFGSTLNAKGYKELPPFLKVIYGDGINYASLKGIVSGLKLRRWSLNNVAFGCGGALLQKVDRDSAQFAFKCSAITTDDGVVHDVFKAPVGTPNKQSKRGLLKLVKTLDGQWATVSAIGAGNDELVTYYKDGLLLVDDSLDIIRTRAAKGLAK